MNANRPLAARQLLICADEVEPLWDFARAVDVHPHTAMLQDPDAPFLGDYFRVMQQVSLKAGDETCHQSLRPLAAGATDFIVETLSGAQSLEDAMRRIARAYNLLHGGVFNRVERRRDRIIYCIDDRQFPYAFPADSGPAHATGEALLIFLHAILSVAVGGDLDQYLVGVKSRRSVRCKRDGFLSFWDAPVRLRAPACTLEYDISVASKSILWSGRRASAFDVYAEIAAMIAAREARPATVDFVADLADIIAAGVSDQSEAARHLGVSVATLRRRLDVAGTSFRRIRAEEMNVRALSLLTDRRHPSDVADALGFSDARSFSRAFKSWNGVTPDAWIRTERANLS